MTWCWLGGRPAVLDDSSAAIDNGFVKRCVVACGGVW